MSRVILFYLIIDDDTEDSHNIKHIQYNIKKRIEMLKHIKYRRIDITLCYDNNENIEVEWNDKRSARVICGVKEEVLRKPENELAISLLYQRILAVLRVLWDLSNYDKTALEKIFEEITNESFVTVYAKKKILSPNKSVSVQLYFRIFPGYAEYFVAFTGKRKEKINEILFLSGYTDVDIFLMFFNGFYWFDNEHVILSDLNQEVYFIFTVEGFTVKYKPRYNTLEKCKEHLESFKGIKTRKERLSLLGLI